MTGTRVSSTSTKGTTPRNGSPRLASGSARGRPGGNRPYPAVGRFESEAFEPEKWKPHTPTPPYMEMLPDDAFWAARRVVAFDDALVRAVVHAGQISDSAAEQHLAAIL